MPQGRHLEVLKWAREHGCQWNWATCAAAAAGGHLLGLKWAREHDCFWCEITWEHAAGGGHLEVLRWAREHDCPWDRDTCEYHRLKRAPGDVGVGAGARLSVGCECLFRGS